MDASFVRGRALFLFEAWVGNAVFLPPRRMSDARRIADVVTLDQSVLNGRRWFC